MDRGANHRNVWLMCVSLVAVLVVASCGGGSESGSGESTLAEIDPGTTLAPGTSTTETESESEVTSEPGTTSEVPDPCSLITEHSASPSLRAGRQSRSVGKVWKTTEPRRLTSMFPEPMERWLI